jgi:hypothetical protein
MKITDGALNGLLAGAAGTTALNAATYIDMALRGRPSSSTPEDTVEMLADKAGTDIPGAGEKRENRVSGLGALNGIATGVGVGAAFGVVRSLGIRPGVLVTAVVATVGVMALTDGVMTALGITDPSEWAPTDWVADLLPHLAYGLTTAVALDRL